MTSAPGAATDDVTVLQYTEGTPQTLEHGRHVGQRCARIERSRQVAAADRLDRGRRRRALESQRRRREDRAGAGEPGELLRGDVQRHSRRRVSRLDPHARGEELDVERLGSRAVQRCDRCEQRPICTDRHDNSAEFVLQNGPNGSRPQGWGWTDNGWGSRGPNVFFATTGTHTIRIQQREDGAIVDEIVISADAYLTVAPGTRTNDKMIVGK